jgi:hypothetical protein
MVDERARDCAASIKKPLAILFKLVIAFWGFPMRVEGVVCCPFVQEWRKRSISSYREISILSAILKFFENLVRDVISPIICPSISDEQHGFVGERSTVTSLVEFSYFVLSEMKNALKVDLVYTNFWKGFR